MSLACDETEGITFIGRKPLPKKFVKRVNAVVKRICELRAAFNKAKFQVNVYCDEDVIPESSSSSSSECFPQCDCDDEIELLYLIDTNHVTDEVLAYLTLIEQNVCDTAAFLEQLKLVSNVNCLETA